MANPLSLVLTKYVEGVFLRKYLQPDDAFIADRVVHKLNSRTQVGKLLEDDDTGLWIRDPRRAPGASAAKYESGLVAGNSFKCIDEVLAEEITEEDLKTAANEFGLDRFEHAGEKLAMSLKRWREANVAGIFRSVDPLTLDYDSALGYLNNYSTQVVTLTDGDHWNQTAGDPLDDLYNANKWFVDNSYFEPNLIIMPKPIHLALRENAQWIAEYGTWRDYQNVTGIGQIRGLDLLVPNARAYNANGTSKQIWGNDVIIASVEPASEANPVVEVTWTDMGGMSVSVEPDPDSTTRKYNVNLKNGYKDRIQSEAGGSTRIYVIQDVLKL